MNYYKTMQEAINEMKDFDKNISVKINELNDVVNEFDFKGMVNEEDNKQVTAHKNRTLRVVNRVIDKFKKEIEQYVLPLITSTEIETNESEDIK